MQRLFGTNGVRGITNKDMNSELALNLGKAIGTFFKGDILIGTDTRTSNEMLKSAVISGLLSVGNNVYDVGISPSPAIQFAVRYFKMDAGIIITASHNPSEFNGIKVIDSNGTELIREKEEKIEKCYFTKNFKIVDWKNIGKVFKKDVNEIYIENIIKLVNSLVIKNANLKVVLDCGNGAGCLTTPYLLQKLGVKVITLNSQIDGNFLAREPEPSKENLKELIEMVIKTNANLGVAHDGDADRTIFIDERGNFIFGDKALALFCKEITREKKGIVVTPISSSSCVEEVVLKNKSKVVYTKVGAPLVARKMIEVNAIFGGEENGGLIFPEMQYCRDGGFAVAKMLEILAKSKKSISELIGELPFYALYKTKVVCEEEKKEVALKELIRKFKDKKINSTDGVKIFYEDGWVLIRASGTEPIYRIFAESKSEEEAKKMAEEGKGILEEIIKKI